MIASVMCRECLDEWDKISPDYYKGMAVSAAVIIEQGTSWCLKHYRAWRDRNVIEGER